MPLSYVERLVLEHSAGTVPAEKALDTPEKIQAYRERMEAATAEDLQRNRRARAESWLAARSKFLS